MLLLLHKLDMNYNEIILNPSNKITVSVKTNMIQMNVVDRCLIFLAINNSIEVTSNTASIPFTKKVKGKFIR